MDDENETETLVTLSIRFPTVDRSAVSFLIGPLMVAAVAAGGDMLTISVMGYAPDDD